MSHLRGFFFVAKYRGVYADRLSFFFSLILLRKYREETLVYGNTVHMYPQIYIFVQILGKFQTRFVHNFIILAGHKPATSDTDTAFNNLAVPLQ